MNPAHSLPGVALLVWCVVTPAVASAQKFYTYVGTIGPDQVTLAWGTTEGKNTIGRSSPSHGPATVRVGERTVTVSDRNWVSITGLTPDTVYDYEVRLNQKRIGAAKIRTWPTKSERLRFFVIGDFGSGDSHQERVAGAMWKEFQRLDGADPVRFVITTGDNIYGQFGITLRFRNTGDSDRHWENKYFEPYERLIARIPVYPSLGNHDGNETESRDDLQVYLDNFFFPSPQPARYYRFSYGGLADFFALDTTNNTERGPPRPMFLKEGDQFRWLRENLEQSEAPWKIPYMHHPPYNAGPRHPAIANDIPHFLDVFRREGVRVAFSGHEHNFQFSVANRETGGIRYVISGAGGELRTGNVSSEMARARIEGWAPQLHFLSVEIQGREMRITPVSYEPVRVVDRNGSPIGMPLVVTLP